MWVIRTASPMSFPARRSISALLSDRRRLARTNCTRRPASAGRLFLGFTSLGLHKRDTITGGHEAGTPSGGPHARMHPGGVRERHGDSPQLERHDRIGFGTARELLRFRPLTAAALLQGADGEATHRTVGV